MSSESSHDGTATTETDVDEPDEVAPDDDSDDAAPVAEHNEDGADPDGVQGDTDGDDIDGDDIDGDETGIAVSGSGGGRFPRRLLYGTAALALASIIVAAVFGVMWLVAGSGDDAELASSRDDVSDSAADAIKAVTEIDYKDPDQFFERSKAVSTDDFGKQLTQAKDQFRKALEKAQTRVKTNVNDVAVQDLNNHEGTATFLAVVSTHISQQDDNATKVLRLKGKMERSSDDEGWKLAGMSQVPVVGNGAGAAQPDKSGKQQQDGDTDKGSGQGSGAGK